MTAASTDPSSSAFSATASLWSQGLAEFRDRTASDSPTPGGGSTAMVSASLGMGLVLMALRVTRKSEQDPGRSADLDNLIQAGDTLMTRMAEHADEDVAAFSGFMEAMRLPKSTEDEKVHRRQAMASAPRVATEVPLNAAATCLEGLDLALRAEQMAKASIVSDVGAGGAILAGALRAVLLGVDINLNSLKDTDLRNDYRASRQHLAKAASDREADLADRVAARLTA